MIEEENKDFNLLQLADEMSHKNWMYFKFLYNKKFKEAEDRTKELEAALRLLIEYEYHDAELVDGAELWERVIKSAHAALGEKKDASA